MPPATTPCAPARTRREPAGGARCSSAQHAEVAVGHVGKRGDTNRGTTLLELVHESRQHPGQLGSSKPIPASPTSWMAAATPVGRRQSARKADQRIRARVFATRGEKDVCTQQFGQSLRRKRRDDTDVLEPRLRVSREGDLEVAARFRSSHSSASAPFRGLSDQLVAINRRGLPASGSRASGGWKIAGSAAFGSRPARAA